MYAAIETSFDEAGVAIANADGCIIRSLLSSQAELHAPYGGCVPELAARTHVSDLPQLWQKLDASELSSLTHMGVTSGPGLPGCLLAGISFARGAAAATGLPLYGLNHLAGHIFSPFMPTDDNADLAPRYPHIALLISGGHTELFLVRSLTEIELLGQTQDDAVGELLDKVSKMLGYGYPGGARLEQIARSYSGMSEAAECSGPFTLPVPMRDHDSFDFSYSGLKTAVVRYVRGDAKIDGRELQESDHPALLAALFAVICESLWIKVEPALRKHDIELVTLSGGVAINGFIRKYFAKRAAEASVEAVFPQPRWCLDNADMMAYYLKLLIDAGIKPQPFDARSNWVPGESV